MNANIKTFTLLIIPMGIFLYALYVLFDLRFDTGSIYPPYSSLRADPLGTKMLYEALGDLPGLKVEQNLEPLVQEPIEDRVLMFYLGHQLTLNKRDPSLGFSSQQRKSFDFIRRTGGRLVISLLPELETREARAESQAADQIKKYLENRSRPAKSRRSDPKPEDPDQADTAGPKASSIWDVAMALVSRDDLATAAQDPGGVQDPGALTWHSTVYFKDPDPAWRVLYQAGGRPVVIERSWGEGAVVLATDSYFLSNEAMIRERPTPLLRHLVAGYDRIVFEESHFSILQQPGVMGLAREYGLQTTMWSFVLLALLFVWKNAVSLVPPATEEQDTAAAGTVGGREASEGFINLLRRHVPASRLIELCFSEWESSYACHRSNLQARRERMARVAKTTSAQDPLSCYKKLNRILKERE